MAQTMEPPQYLYPSLDPRVSVKSLSDRAAVISYGNRLFCDADGEGLRHRWGSAKLYRGFFQDYRRFLARPEIVAEQVSVDGGMSVVVVRSDLRQFYDRVRPELLADKIASLRESSDDPAFFELAGRVLRWHWHERDRSEVEGYARLSELTSFETVALPQGLVSAGFFSNVALLDFDRALRAAVGADFVPNATLHDGCRYVDDSRQTRA